ncbi:MAG: hypothetical protein ACRDIA_06530, partial [Actinomycetota bacterium]
MLTRGLAAFTAAKIRRMDLGKIFKAYDVRGIYPEEIDEEAVRRIGGAFAEFNGSRKILVGRDMR